MPERHYIKKSGQKVKKNRDVKIYWGGLQGKMWHLEEDSSAINKSWEKRVAVQVIDMIKAHSKTVHGICVTENTTDQVELDSGNREFE